MNTTIDAALAFTKREEGGYTNDRRDSGNWTSGVVGKGILMGSNMGVGAPCLVAYNARNRLKLTMTAATMRGLSPTLYKAIATSEYWHLMSCDLLPIGVDLMVFDYGWNRGNSNSIHELQETLGVDSDGDFGPASQAAMASVNDLASFVQTLGEVQTEHYQALDNFATYGKGWLARTARRQATALEAIAAAPIA